VDLYPISQPIRLSTEVKTAGVLGDPGALVLSYVLNAPGSVAVVKNWPSPAEITRDNAGQFHFDSPGLAVAGQYRETWTSTGTNAGSDTDVFDVFDPAGYPRLVSFDDAKTVVKALGDQDDPLLDRIIGWASARILMEFQAYRQTFTQTVTVRGGDYFFKLSHTPVVSITSVTALGLSLTPPAVATLVPTIPNAGHVECTQGRLYGSYQVTYLAGSATVPPGVDGACLALIQHWWGQMVSRRSATYGQGPAGAMPDFRGLPNTVRNLLDTTSTPWGFA
jgi:hypothetical protein